MTPEDTADAPLDEEAAAEEELRAAEASADGKASATEGEQSTPLPAGSKVFFVARADGKEERSATLRVGHVIEGRLIDGNGEKLAEAELLLMLESGETLHARADKDGRFEFRGLPESSAVLVAASPPLKKQLSKLQKVSFVSSPVLGGACHVTRTSYHGFGINWSMPGETPDAGYFGKPWEMAWLKGLGGQGHEDWSEQWNKGVLATQLGPRLGSEQEARGVMLGGHLQIDGAAAAKVAAAAEDGKSSAPALRLLDLFSEG